VIHLIRHGETAWSRTRRHTGRTDVPLTDEGRAQARALAPLLAGVRAAVVLTSPLGRATETCALAGYGERATTDERLVEWDYGEAEGRTTAELQQEIPGWTVWTHPCPGGETLAEVADRVDAVLADLRRADGDVVLFAHAHLLRILAARWCGWPPTAGSNLTAEPASWGRLDLERDVPVIAQWNLVPAVA
jgi:probable phosphoglycerate mutase